MKIIHTSDWHIGKLVHGLHMTEDQEYILNQFVQYIKDNKPDVIIIAGDIYDRTVPPVEAVELFDSIITRIVLEEQVPVIAIAGNHDSPERLGFANGILKKQGLYIYNDLSQIDNPIILEDAYGQVAFYPIPYVDPPIAREYYNDETIKTHDDVFRTITNNIRKQIKPNMRSVCIAHGLIIGSDNLEISESERPLTIGGTEHVDVNYFEDFNYVALGHLHRPQKVKHEHIRYAGSLLKYSFSEAEQKKGMTIVEIDESGNVKHENINFKTLRDMRIIKGELKELMQKEVYSLQDCNDYIMVTLTDQGELFEPLSVLRTVYPNVLRLERALNNEIEYNQELINSDFKQKNPYELFMNFYEDVEGNNMNEETSKLVKDVIDEVIKGVI